MSNTTNQIYLYPLTDKIIYYYLVSTIPIGIAGNLISLFVYMRPNLNKNTNTGFLYSWLSVINLVVILVYALEFRAPILFNYTLKLPCGVNNYLRRIVLTAVTWMQVVISFERFVIVIFPSKKPIIQKKNVLYSVMLGVFAFDLVVNMTNLLSYQTSLSTNITIFDNCYMSLGTSIATSLIAIVVRIYIPFILMATCDAFVIKRLRRSKIKVAASFSNDPGLQQRHQHQISHRDYRFTVSTIIIDLTFFIFYTPLAGFFGISIAGLFNNSLWSPITGAYIYFFNNLSQLLSFGHTIALVFLSAFFNRYFREELIYLCTFKRIQPNNSLSRGN